MKEKEGGEGRKSFEETVSELLNWSYEKILSSWNGQIQNLGKWKREILINLKNW